MQVIKRPVLLYRDSKEKDASIVYDSPIISLGSKLKFDNKRFDFVRVDSDHNDSNQDGNYYL
jgi:hypothetical protein